MKLIIAGGRNYQFTTQDVAHLSLLCVSNEVTQIITGGAMGADMHGMKFAQLCHLSHVEVRADWGTHGVAAGPMRNRAMAELGDALAIFPGGKGTASMRREAKAKSLKIFDFNGDRECLKTSLLL